MAKQIPLTQEKFAIVDDADYEWLNRHRWFVRRDGRNWYAIRWVGGRENRKLILMHREILGMPKGVGVDHRDCNGLNNVRANLRLATAAENQHNARKPKTNSSGCKGVCWHKSARCWVAQIEVNGHHKTIGYFKGVQNAARAYDKTAKKYFGEFARPNEA